MKEKIVIREWKDLGDCLRLNLGTIISVKYSDVDMSFLGGQLEKAVKVLNSLGGNFEYKPVEVIDTLEKWEKFQEKICRFSYVYDRVLGVFIEMRADNDNESFVDIIDGDVTVKKIEEKYNVDLKILK